MKRLLVSLGILGAVIFGNLNTPLAAPVLSVFFDSDTECGGNCFGSTYQLVVDDGGTTDNHYIVTLTVNASGENSSGTYISAVDFKASASATNATLTAGPGGAANWITVFNAGQAGNECTGSGNGFVTSCDEAPSNLAPVPNPTSYSWTWAYETSGAIAFGHLGVKYDNEAGNLPGQILSIGSVSTTSTTPTTTTPTTTTPTNTPTTTTPTQVPEPSSMFLIGSGLIGLSAYVRRRTRQS